MSRCGYSDDYDNWSLIKYRGVLASSIRGKRGQKFLCELAQALDAMPEKKLIQHDLERDGCVCALGAAGKARGVDLSTIDPYDAEKLAQVFDIAEPLAREVAYQNDECGIWKEPPEARWTRMRSWVDSVITKPEGTTTNGGSRHG